MDTWKKCTEQSWGSRRFTKTVAEHFHASCSLKRFVFSGRRVKRAKLTAFPALQHCAPTYRYWRRRRMQSIFMNAHSTFSHILLLKTPPPVRACSAKTLENAIFHWKNSIVFSQRCPRWKAPALPWAVLTATTSIQPLGYQTRLKARSGWRLLFKKPKITIFHTCSSQCYQAGESFPLGRSQSSVSDLNPSDFAIYCTLL